MIDKLARVQYNACEVMMVDLIIPQRETLEIEFKSDEKKLHDNELIDAVVAFANTNGGDLYLGVEDDGRITGLHPDHRDGTQLSAFIANKTMPPVSVRIEMIKAEKDTVKSLAQISLWRIHRCGTDERSVIAQRTEQRIAQTKVFELLAFSQQPSGRVSRQPSG